MEFSVLRHREESGVSRALPLDGPLSHLPLSHSEAVGSDAAAGCLATSTPTPPGEYVDPVGGDSPLQNCFALGLTVPEDCPENSNNVIIRSMLDSIGVGLIAPYGFDTSFFPHPLGRVDLKLFTQMHMCNMRK